MTPQARIERCTRCLQPISHSARRCPHCGEMTQPNERKLSLVLAVGGAIAIVLVALVLLFFLNPPTVDTDNQVDQQEQGPPAQPAKKPVLD